MSVTFPVAVIKYIHLSKRKFREKRIILAQSPSRWEAVKAWSSWSHHMHSQEAERDEQALSSLSPLGSVKDPSHRNGAVHSSAVSSHLIGKALTRCLGTCLLDHSRSCQADNQYEPSQLLSCAQVQCHRSYIDNNITE